LWFYYLEYNRNHRKSRQKSELILQPRRKTEQEGEGEEVVGAVLAIGGGWDMGDEELMRGAVLVHILYLPAVTVIKMETKFPHT
jgi:hypothetical protein